MIFRFFSLIVCGVAVAGCQPGDLRTTAVSSRAIASGPIFATQLAGPSTFLAPMPTAIVILKPDNPARNRAFCSAVTSRLPTAEQAMAASPIAPNVILTRWLVQVSEVPADRASDCDFLTSTYDYARADRLLQSVHLSEGQVSHQGPFLFMVVPDNDGIHVVGLDGSAESQENFGVFVDRWGSALRRTEAAVTRQPDQPGIVRSFFNLVTANVRTAAGMGSGLIRGFVNGL